MIGNVGGVSNEIQVRAGARILFCDPAGPMIAGEADCLDLVGEALGVQADIVAVPVSRLADGFFALRTGLAGAIVQKFVNYRLTLAVVGDISSHVKRSDALRAFVGEANRGRHTWFVPTGEDLDDLIARTR